MKGSLKSGQRLKEQGQMWERRSCWDIYSLVVWKWEDGSGLTAFILVSALRDVSLSDPPKRHFLKSRKYDWLIETGIHRQKKFFKTKKYLLNCCLVVVHFWRHSAKLETRRNFFSSRVVEAWNMVLGVINRSKTVISFKNAYRRHGEDMVEIA